VWMRERQKLKKEKRRLVFLRECFFFFLFLFVCWLGEIFICDNWLKEMIFLLLLLLLFDDDLSLYLSESLLLVIKSIISLTPLTHPETPWENYKKVKIQSWSSTHPISQKSIIKKRIYQKIYLSFWYLKRHI